MSLAPSCCSVHQQVQDIACLSFTTVMLCPGMLGSATRLQPSERPLGELWQILFNHFWCAFLRSKGRVTNISYSDSPQSRAHSKSTTLVSIPFPGTTLCFPALVWVLSHVALASPVFPCSFGYCLFADSKKKVTSHCRALNRAVDI